MTPWTPPVNLAPRFEFDAFVLRPYTPDDAEALFKTVDASRATLLPWLPWAKAHNTSVKSAAESIESFRKSVLDPLEPHNNALFGFVIGVWDRATGELVGSTGFNRMSAETHNAETGYWVSASRRRQGIAAKSLAAVLSWGFTPQAAGGFGFRRVHIFAAEPNQASAGVPRKLGLREILHARNDRWVDGYGWCDTLGWDVLAEEWDVAGRRLR